MDSKPFWDWAVAAYAAPGVAETCLSLQDDHCQNVPLLLWAAWRGTDDAAKVAESVAMARLWEAEAIAPLRKVRRRLKAYMPGDEAARLAARDKVKASELALERALMLGLEGLGRSDTAAADPMAALTAVSRASGGEPPLLTLRQLCQALSDGGFLRYTT